MEKRISLQLLFVCLFFSSAVFAQAQDENPRRFFLTLYGGMSAIHGDVENEWGNFTGTAGLGYALSSTTSLEGFFTYGYMTGAGEQNPSRAFRNDYYLYGGRLNLSLYNLFRFNEFTNTIYPFANVGAAYMASEVTGTNPTSDPNDYGVDYQGQDLVIQSGVGVNFYLSRTVDLKLRWDYHAAKSDLLDGYDPTGYPNKYTDAFSTFNMGLTFKFGRSGSDYAWYVKQQNEMEEKMNDILNDLEKDKQELKNDIDKNSEDIEDLKHKVGDEDGDGVINAVDTEITDPEVEHVDSKGRPMDTDYDGIPDHLDDCPTQRGNAENNGCPTNGGTTPGGTGTPGTDNGTTDDGRYGEVSDNDLANDPDFRSERVLTMDGSVGSRKYYVIGGSFGVARNAERFSRQLNSQGYNTFIIMDPSGTLYRVALGSYDDPGRALRELERYRRIHDPKTWMIINR